MGKQEEEVKVEKTIKKGVDLDAVVRDMAKKNSNDFIKFLDHKIQRLTQHQSWSFLKEIKQMIIICIQ